MPTIVRGKWLLLLLFNEIPVPFLKKKKKGALFFGTLAEYFHSSTKIKSVAGDQTSEKVVIWQCLVKRR